MVSISLPDELVRELEVIAEEQKRPIADIVADLLQKYRVASEKQNVSDEAFESMFGIFDDDVTDMSITVRETMGKYYREKYGRTD